MVGRGRGSNGDEGRKERGYKLKKEERKGLVVKE